MKKMIVTVETIVKNIAEASNTEKDIKKALEFLAKKGYFVRVEYK